MLKKNWQMISKLDIVAGIPSFNEENSISFVVKQIDKALTKYFSGKKAIIVCCDGGSTDDTNNVFLGTKTRTEKLFLQTKKGVTGKGNAFKMLFNYAVKAKAKAIVVNDADLKSINPEWVKLQIDAILKKGYDFTIPYYSRYKYGGTITNNICYPLIKALFCHDIRQPIGGDFSVSPKLAEHWLKSFWPANAAFFGIDIFMTINAILGGFKICQVSLGSKDHRVKDPALTLDKMFIEVISTLFKLTIVNKDKIRGYAKVKKIHLLGPKMKKEPKAFEINVQRLNEKFISGFKENNDIIKKCLSTGNYFKIKEMINKRNINITPNLLAKIVYDYIIAYKKCEKESSAILKSLIPIWLGRTSTFIRQTLDYNHWEAEKEIIKQADTFFELRDYLFSKL